MAKAPRFKVGTARAEPGAWTTGTLTLGHYPDGPITTPVNILCGTRPGPVLWVQSAIHGAECGGALGLLRLFKRIDPKRMKGAIIGIMAANPTAFRVLGRNTPYDGENMNRLLEKPSQSGHSRQAASILIETACAVADAVMDMHSGGQDTVVPFYSIYWEDGSASSQAASRLARATGTAAIWNSTDAWLGGAMYTAVTKRGKPAIIVECGSGGDLTDRDVANNMKAMAVNDEAFFYHSGDERRVVGIVKVVRTYYPDSTDESGRFGRVDFKAVRPLKTPVSLAQVKDQPKLQHLALVRQSRLSVMPIDDSAWTLICKMGGIAP